MLVAETPQTHHTHTYTHKILTLLLPPTKKANAKIHHATNAHTPAPSHPCSYRLLSCSLSHSLALACFVALTCVSSGSGDALLANVRTTVASVPLRACVMACVCVCVCVCPNCRRVTAVAYLRICIRPWGKRILVKLFKFRNQWQDLTRNLRLYKEWKVEVAKSENTVHTYIIISDVIYI